MPHCLYPSTSIESVFQQLNIFGTAFNIKREKSANWAVSYQACRLLLVIVMKQLEFPSDNPVE